MKTVVIGAGLAGLNATLTLQDAGHEVTLVEVGSGESGVKFQQTQVRDYNCTHWERKK